MIRVLFYTIISLFILFFFEGCKRTQKDGFLGPELKVASKEFTLIDSFKVYGKDNVDFISSLANLTEPETTKVVVPDPVIAGGTKIIDVITPKPRSISFKAKFNEKVRWRIEIQPRYVDSLAKSRPDSLVPRPFKLISGISDYIDNTPEWTWDGSSDNQYYFVPGNVDFKLIVLGLKDTVLISKKLVNGITYSSNAALLLNDFEGTFGITSYGDKNEKIAYPNPYIVGNIPFTPQGKKSLLIAGTDYNGDYFVAGNQQKFTKGTLAGYNASEIYINVYIYGFPSGAGLTPNATKVSISASQDNRNGNGEFEAANEDTFEQQIAVDWVGWRLISVKYSNLKRSSSTTDGGSGPNKIQPATAVQIGTNLLSSPNGSTVAAAVDYVIVTFGKPLDK